MFYVVIYLVASSVKLLMELIEEPSNQIDQATKSFQVTRANNLQPVARITVSHSNGAPISLFFHPKDAADTGQIPFSLMEVISAQNLP